MIAIDANLLLYAYDRNAAEHERARSWLEHTFSNAPMIGLPLVSILAFLRISTDPRIHGNPRAVPNVASIVHTWLDRENVTVLEPGTQHWPIFFDIVRDVEITGPRMNDAHLAALSIEHGATFFTNDRDFRVFSQLDVRFPLRDQ